MNRLFLIAALTLPCITNAGQTDIINPKQVPSGGWSTAHTNIGQSFNALAADIKIETFIADSYSWQLELEAWQKTCAPYCGVSAWDATINVAASVAIDVKVYEGEGMSGPIVYQTPIPIVLTKPYNDVITVNLGAAGVFLTPGHQYTVIYTEVDGNQLPYWQYFGTIDRVNADPLNPNNNHGAYYGGWLYINGVQQNPDANIGDLAFRVIDNNPPAPMPVMPSCSGSSAIAQGINASKLFMLLANNQKVAYSNVYGSQGTTVFAFNGGLTSSNAFSVGNIVTYTGVLDASTICVPDTLSISPAPVVIPPTPTSCPTGQVLQGGTCVPAPVVPTPTIKPPTASCIQPSGAKKVEGKAKITAVGVNSITVGKTVVFFADCTIRELNGGATSYAIGQTAEYKGFKFNGSITATKVTIN
jgi:hypothetical protein